MGAGAQAARGRVTRDRYALYQAAVQDPTFEVRFLRRLYRTFYGAEPRRLREDFCGTALVACEWVRRVREGEALGVDLDPEPLAWGQRHNLPPLGTRARRVRLLRADVRAARGFRPDVVAALNFSYFVFKRRRDLADYFRSVRRSLAPTGLFVLDVYGGPEAQRVVQERRRCEGFTYVWDQAHFNPITGETLCHIHFEFPDGTRLRRAFTYDWRLWTLPELQDLLAETGFRRIEVYWEGTNRRTGQGNGVFRRSRRGDLSEAWVAYLAAAK